MKKQSGFAVIEVLLLVIVVGILGYTAYSYLGYTSGAKGGTPEASTATVPAAPAVNNTVDLTTAETTLDQTDIDANIADDAKLQSELAAF